MISFIIIGKNEGWRLEKCLSAVRRIASKELKQPFEIIYIDSQSTDNSIEISKKYADKVFLITGVCNAAIGRNIGAKEASGNILFFLDGDMELLEGVLMEIITTEGNLIYPFLSGVENEYLYDNEWNYIETRPRRGYVKGKDLIEEVTGGLFTITKELWNKVGGMDNRFTRSEDSDIGFRLCYKGVLLKRMGMLWVNHYTKYYAVRKDPLTVYRYPALLTRKHFFSLSAQKNLLVWNYSSYLFFISIVLFTIFSNFIIMIPYLLCLIYRSNRIINRTGVKLGLLETIFSRFFQDCLLIYYFFCYYPKHSKELYIYVKKEE